MLVFILSASPVLAFQPPKHEPVHYRESFLRKYFDFNRNGSLDRYEWGLLMTQQRMGYHLVTKKKMKAFDENADRMLEPYEYENYKKSRKKSTGIQIKI